MNIAIVGTSWPFKGGLAAYNERLARQLQVDGHTVTIYTFTLQYPGFLYPGQSQYADTPEPEDLEIKRCINSINPANWIKVGNAIRKDSPDLLLIKFWLPFMGPCFGTILSRVRKNRHTRVITIIDNIIPHESRPGDRAFTRYFVKHVDALIAMSASVLDDIGQFNKVKPRILTPHPLYDQFGAISSRAEAAQALGLPRDKSYMLFFGIIRDYKGLDLLLEAISHPEVRKLNLQLLVAGEFYSDKQKYLSMIDEHRLSGHVILADRFIPDSEVGHYFNLADIVVQPYKSATQSGVTQIAYYFEKPMIVTNVGGLPEICPDGEVGYVVPADPTDIAHAIVRFYTATDRDAMIARVREEKKKYSWSALTENILTLAEKLNDRFDSTI